MEKCDIPCFSYNENDFMFKIYHNNKDSKFDIALKEKWNTIEDSNILRYSIKSQQSKVLEGKYAFYAQLNVERATNRRRPEEMMSMRQPFDPNRFNFMKISDKEILFDVGNGDGNDILAVNVSPILWSHCLLLTQRFSGLSQSVTLYSFQKAIEILLLSNSENMRVLFNSICANASVNHLHWHLYYLDHRMFLESVQLQYLGGSVYILEDYPAKGFCIKLSSFKDQNIKKYVSYAYKIVSCLQENEIAHNIYITRAKTNANDKEFDDIRTYIWARETNYGVKNTNDFIIAACECFGHLPIKSEESYKTLSENYVCQRLEEIVNSVFFDAREKILQSILQKDADEKNVTTEDP